MKTNFENIQLTVTTENRLRTSKPIFGSITINAEQTSATFREEIALPFPLGKHKSVQLFHKAGFGVKFNTETGKYKISVTIDTDNPIWMDDADEAWNKCMNYLARRTNA